MRSYSLLIGSSLLAVLSIGASPVRADLLPECDQAPYLDSLITCAAADVGKPCQGAGTCFAVPCASSVGATSMIYKCDVCPTIVPLPDAGCVQTDHSGPACGDGGLCVQVPSYCPTDQKIVCAIAAASAPTGPPGGGKGGAGCAVGALDARGPGGVAVGLLLIGAAFLAYDRRRG